MSRGPNFAERAQITVSQSGPPPAEEPANPGFSRTPRAYLNGGSVGPEVGPGPVRPSSGGRCFVPSLWPWDDWARRAGGPASLMPPRRPSGRRACCFVSPWVRTHGGGLVLWGTNPRPSGGLKRARAGLCRTRKRPAPAFTCQAPTYQKYTTEPAESASLCLLAFCWHRDKPPRLSR